MGRGVLHFLALGVDDKEKDDHVKNSEAAQEFFNVASAGIDFEISGVTSAMLDEKQIKLEIPILPDMYGTTPLDISLAISIQRKTDENVFYSADDSLKEVT